MQSPLIPNDRQSRMTTLEALRVLVRLRHDRQLVITNQQSARVWPALSNHPLDFNYVPSTMGGAIPLALGVALARPELHVVCVSGDGSLLMNLGCLVSVTDAGVPNLSILVLDNGVYEVTGGQRTPAGEDRTDYAAIARSVGFPVSVRFDDAKSWDAASEQLLSSPGPHFLCLRVQPRCDPQWLEQPAHAAQQLKGLVSALGSLVRPNYSRNG